jgi:hypothetical protein
MKVKKALAALTLLSLAATAGQAQTDHVLGMRGAGVRAGFGLDPDQGIIGAQAVLGHASRFAAFAPSVDLGFGSDLTTVMLNGDIFVPLFAPAGTSAGVYLAGGPALAIWEPSEGDGDTEIGLTVAPGLRLPLGNRSVVTLESRFGIGDIPEFRGLAGVLFAL